MGLRQVYHLGLSKRKTRGARFAFLTGPPERVPEIAKALNSKSRELAWIREFRTWSGKFRGEPVLVTSTGIGGPSTSIAIDELAQLGVKTFIRIGTTGAIQEDIEVGDVIITTGSVRLDGASTHYAPIEYPAVADYEVTHALVKAAKESGLKFRVGITASTDTFYPGQERYDSCSGYVVKRLQGSMKEWQKLHVLNYEMESSALLTIAAALGLKAGCVTGVVVNRTRREGIKQRDVKVVEENAITVAIKAIEFLIPG